MTDRVKEQISAFVDGELPDEEGVMLVRRLADDTGLRAAFARYHVIGSILRGGECASADFAARVSQAVDNEAPLPPVAAAARRIMRPAGMAAMAASVALVAIVGVQTLRQAPLDPAAAGTEMMVADSAESDPRYVVPETNATSLAPLSGSELARYVVSHGRYATRPGSPGVMNYRALVAESGELERPGSARGEELEEEETR